MADRVVDEGTCQFCFRRQAVRPDRKIDPPEPDLGLGGPLF